MIVPSLIAIVIVLMLAYLWASRGFFSALLHMISVIIAGAVAFAVWEPLAYLLMQSVSGDWVVASAWGVSLAIPFALTLAVVRVGIDKLIPANAILDGVPNLVGGGLCGAISGVIASGILMLSVSYMRVPPGLGRLWYQPIGYETNGSLKREGKLLLPVDTLTVAMYSAMSESTLREPLGTPLAQLHPRMADEGHILAMPLLEGFSQKHTIKPRDFTFLGSYTVGRDAANRLSIPDLTKDTIDPKRSQTVTSITGDQPPANAYIGGYVITFNAAAKDKGGKVVVGPNTLRLVYQTADGAAVATQPFALISQAESADLALGRWRFSAPNTYIGSVGGAAEATMAFEFLIPRDANPTALYVKGTRVDLAGTTPAQEFATVAERDREVRRGPRFFESVSGGAAQAGGGAAPTGRGQVIESGVEVTTRMPERIVVNKGDRQGLELDDANKIVEGEARFRPDQLQNFGLERTLRVDQFAASDDTVVVQIVMDARNSQFGLLSDAAADKSDSGQTPVLVDDRGTTYPPIGFVYTDSTQTHIRFTPSKPIFNLSDLQTLSRSRPDQKLTLLYRPSFGVKITKVAMGGKVLATLQTPITLDRRQ